MNYNQITLVTGASGFIGSHIVRALAAQQVAVRAVDLKLPDAASVDSLKKQGVECVAADLRNPDQFLPLLENVDRIFHVAGICNLTTPYSQLEPINVTAVHHLSKIALEAKTIKRFIHFSSSSVYGLYKGSHFTETSPCKPADDYGVSKQRGENIIKQRISEGLQATILRPCTVYGPGCNDGAGKVFSRPSNIPGIPGSGRQKLANVRVEDVVGAAIYLSKQKEAIGQIYNIADNSHPELEQALVLAAQTFQTNIKRIHVPLALLKVVARLEGIIAKLKRKIPDLEYEAIKYLYSDYIVDNTKLKQTGYQLQYPDFETSLLEIGKLIKRESTNK